MKTGKLFQNSCEELSFQNTRCEQRGIFHVLVLQSILRRMQAAQRTAGKMPGLQNI